jgi:hypothetical protein
MRHEGSIGKVEVRSGCDFIVFGPCVGLAAECEALADAKRALREQLAKANERNVISDLSIYRWSEGNWLMAVSPYEIQEWEIERNPSRVIRFP